MRCYICDSVISGDDIEYDARYEKEKYGPYCPCASCRIAIDESFEDPLSEEEIDRLLEAEDEPEQEISTGYQDVDGASEKPT